MTVSNYCSFLNEAAVADMYSFYDEKMDFILRSGVPGSYRYDVTAEDEEKLMVYGDQNSAMCYRQWKQGDKGFKNADFERKEGAADVALQSNRIICCNMKQGDELLAKSSGKGTSGKTMLGIVAAAIGVFGTAETRPRTPVEESVPLIIQESTQENSLKSTGVLHATAVAEATGFELLPLRSEFVGKREKTETERHIDRIKAKPYAAAAKIRIAQLAEKIQEAQEQVQSSTGDITAVWGEVVSALKQALVCWKKMVQARMQGDLFIAEEFEKVAEEFEGAVEHWKRSAMVLVSEKENEVNNFSWIALSIRRRANIMLQATEARARGETTLGEDYSAIEKVYLEASQKLQRAVEIRALGKESEANSWYHAGDYTLRRANVLAEALEKRALKLEQGYSTIARIFLETAESYQRAAEAKALGRKNEGDSWDQAGFSTAEHYEALAYKSDKRENEHALYREASEIFAEAAKQFQLAAEARSSEVSGVSHKGNSWHCAGQSTHARATTIIQAIEARRNNKTSLAGEYDMIATIFLEAAKQSQQAAESFASDIPRTRSEASSLVWAGYTSHKRAVAMMQSIEARENNHASLAEKYGVIAEVFSESEKKYHQAVEVRGLGKESEADSWHYAGSSICKRAETLFQAIQSGEREGTIVASAYSEAAEKYQHAGEESIQAAQAWAREDHEEAKKRDFQAQAMCKEAVVMIQKIEEK